MLACWRANRGQHPILVSTHSDTSAFNYESYARSWHRFVADPSNGVSSRIVVTPVFVPFAKFDQPQGHHRLSWNDTNDAAADLARILAAPMTRGRANTSTCITTGLAPGPPGTSVRCWSST